MAQLSRNLGNTLKPVSQQSMDGVAQRAKVLKVQLATSLKHRESDFRLEGTKVLNEIKSALEKCNTGALHGVANCTTMLFNRLVYVLKVNSNDATPSGALSDREAITCRPINFNGEHT